MTRWQRAVANPPGPVKALIFLTAIVAYSTTGFMYFEHDAKPEIEWLDALWWSIVTMTTVGFGDYFPATKLGRIFVGIPTMLVGMGMLGYVLSQIASFFIRAEALNRKGLAVQKSTNHVLMLNYPSEQRVLRVLAELHGQPELSERPITIVDEHLEELDDGLAGQNVRFVRGHPARRATLEKASAATATCAVILARDAQNTASDDLTVAICLTLRHLQPSLHVVAECVDPENREVLSRAGCRSIVCVTDLAPGILVQELHDPGVVEVLHELTLWHEDLNNIYIVGLTLGESNDRAVRDLQSWAAANDSTLLGIRKKGVITINPAPGMPLEGDDAAVIICKARPDHIRI